MIDRQLDLVILNALAYNEAPSNTTGWFFTWRVPCGGPYIRDGITTTICDVFEIAVEGTKRVLNLLEAGDLLIPSPSSFLLPLVR